ncbi:class I SAM-dependent methyltransferase [Aliamphritea spongicola]|nr:class I SAM-dependent methyltransferase [Aliamphritea spongicola]
MQTELKEYYKNRATEFDEIYTRPERQQDIQQLTAFLKNSLAGKHVLEIACGTGFWTQKYSTDAASVLATDYNEAVLQVARSKDYSNPNIEFVADDAYSLSNVSQKPTPVMPASGCLTWKRTNSAHSYKPCTRTSNQAVPLYLRIISTLKVTVPRSAARMQRATPTKPAH